MERQRQLLSLALQSDHRSMSQSMKKDAVETLRVVNEINHNMKEAASALTSSIDGQFDTCGALGITSLAETLYRRYAKTDS